MPQGVSDLQICHEEEVISYGMGTAMILFAGFVVFLILANDQMVIESLWSGLFITATIANAVLFFLVP